MYKIEEKSLQEIINYINKYTNTGTGLPLLNLINQSISKCNCEEWEKSLSQNKQETIKEPSKDVNS
jgi:hypothetical protein